MEGGLKTNISLYDLADGLVRQTKSLLERARTEEDLRVGFEKLLESIRSELNLQYVPKYEKSAYKGRSDAVHGQLIIEYKEPRSLSSKSRVDHAYKQLVDYLKAEMEAEKTTKMVGVGFDGGQIFFVKYEGESEFPIDPSKFILRGPYEFNTESAITFLIHLRALSRLPLNAENLAQKFGPQSHSAKKMLSALVNALRHWGNQTRIHTFFDEWQRLFGIVYGEHFTESLLQKEAVILSRLYKVGGKPTFHELLFCIHTYFAFLIKLIAAEILTLRETSLGSSFASGLVHMKDDELRRALDDIEKGGIYARKGISNFLEGDFFQWYLDAFDSPELRDAIREIARGLSEFEPATSTIDPTSIRDLLKKLYQYLVPRGIRRSLGEYYTPDWLAELLLDEVGYDGDLSKRLLDPACGSGTFLVLAIQRAKERGQRENLPPVEIAKRVVANIWGFDLNPLAVIAARTNYLFALGDLIKELPRIEVPIYLTDSLLTPTRASRDLFGRFLEVSTSVGKFQIPVEWIRNGGFLLSIAAPLIEEMVKSEYSVNEAITRLKSEGLIVSNNEQVVKNFYTQILELEKQGKNGIWVRLLKNTFAPVAAGKFDFVVGNPPWVRWDYLSQDYRNATLQLWKDYGLFSLRGFQSRLGGGKKDLSMLFVYVSADYYLKNGGKLGFLITQEVFKSKGAGEGFRRFQIGDREYLKVLKAHDLATIQPFEGATNKTALIVLKKGEKTKYPLPYIFWTKKKGVGRIPTNIPLKDAIVFLQKKKLVAKPIDSSVGPWQTKLATDEYFLKIKGKNNYRAFLGANGNPYGVFWLEIKHVFFDGSILIRNLAEKGRKRIPRLEERIESDLVYPAIRGKDIQRWKVDLEIYMLVVQDPETRKGYPEEFLKNNYPRTFVYLTKFKDILLRRPLYKKFYADKKAPFYSQFNISKNTFSNFKVVWKRMTNDLVAAVVSQIKTPIGWKAVIPLETTAFIPTDNELEAHYLCAIINSKPVRDFVKSFSSAGRGFGTPSVMEHIGIPKFDPKNELHLKLAEISKRCHQLKAEGKEEEIRELENENDELVEELFGITFIGDRDDLE
jgi:type I restriction-modification system DNA methylase subunit